MKAKTYWKFLTYHSCFIIQNKIVVSLNSSLQHWFPTCQGNNEQRTVPRLWESFSCSLLVFSFMHQRRQCQPTPVLLPGKSHGWRSLVGCSPWGCKESDTTEWLHFHFSMKPRGFSEMSLMPDNFDYTLQQHILTRLWESGLRPLRDKSLGCPTRQAT